MCYEDITWLLYLAQAISLVAWLKLAKSSSSAQCMLISNWALVGWPHEVPRTMNLCVSTLSYSCSSQAKGQMVMMARRSSRKNE